MNRRMCLAFLACSVFFSGSMGALMENYYCSMHPDCMHCPKAGEWTRYD